MGAASRCRLTTMLVVAAYACVWFSGCHAGDPAVAGRERLAPSSVETSQEQLLGDLNGNGVPDVSDAIGVLRIVVGLDPSAPSSSETRRGQSVSWMQSRSGVA